MFCGVHAESGAPRAVIGGGGLANAHGRNRAPPTFDFASILGDGTHCPDSAISPSLHGPHSPGRWEISEYQAEN